MALDFPSSPSVGQIYTYLGRSWQWDGTSWVTATYITGPTGATGGNGATGATGPNAAWGSITGTLSSQTDLQNALNAKLTASNGKALGLIEDGTVSATAATGALNYDVKTQSLLLYTSNASGNWTLNIRGDGSTTLDSLMAVGDSMTIAFLVTQGATPYYCTAITIDGNSNTPKWQGGTAPTAGNASGIDSYTYTVIKTASATFTVLAAQTQFK